jgi:hypothetical protein
MWMREESMLTGTGWSPIAASTLSAPALRTSFSTAAAPAISTLLVAAAMP